VISVATCGGVHSLLSLKGLERKMFAIKVKPLSANLMSILPTVTVINFPTLSYIYDKKEERICLKRDKYADISIKISHEI
jgi:hypothetical protein